MRTCSCASAPGRLNAGTPSPSHAPPASSLRCRYADLKPPSSPSPLPPTPVIPLPQAEVAGATLGVLTQVEPEAPPVAAEQAEVGKAVPEAEVQAQAGEAKGAVRQKEEVAPVAQPSERSLRGPGAGADPHSPGQAALHRPASITHTTLALHSVSARPPPRPSGPQLLPLACAPTPPLCPGAPPLLGQMLGKQALVPLFWPCQIRGPEAANVAHTTAPWGPPGTGRSGRTPDSSPRCTNSNWGRLPGTLAAHWRAGGPGAGARAGWSRAGGADSDGAGVQDPGCALRLPRAWGAACPAPAEVLQRPPSMPWRWPWQRSPAEGTGVRQARSRIVPDLPYTNRPNR